MYVLAIDVGSTKIGVCLLKQERNKIKLKAKNTFKNDYDTLSEEVFVFLKENHFNLLRDVKVVFEKSDYKNVKGVYCIGAFVMVVQALNKSVETIKLITGSIWQQDIYKNLEHINSPKQKAKELLDVLEPKIKDWNNHERDAYLLGKWYIERF